MKVGKEKVEEVQRVKSREVERLRRTPVSDQATKAGPSRPVEKPKLSPKEFDLVNSLVKPAPKQSFRKGSTSSTNSETADKGSGNRGVAVDKEPVVANGTVKEKRKKEKPKN